MLNDPDGVGVDESVTVAVGDAVSSPPVPLDPPPRQPPNRAAPPATVRNCRRRVARVDAALEGAPVLSSDIPQQFVPGNKSIP
jgi:hypothetical protein